MSLAPAKTLTDHQRALLNHARAGRMVRVLHQSGDVGAVLVLVAGEPISACRRSTFNTIRHRFGEPAHVRGDDGRTIANDYRLLEEICP